MIKKSLLILMVFWSFSAQAQEKNHIAVNPFLPFFGTFQVQYERIINHNMSVSLSLGYKVSSGVFTIPGIDTDKITTDDFNFRGIKIIPEFRWYLQNQGLLGFYTGVYLKHQNYVAEIEGVYVDNAYGNSDVSLEFGIETAAVGVQIGYKLRVKNRLFIDFLIAGPGVSFNTLEIKENKPIPESFYSDISESISKYDIFELLDRDITIDANKKSKTILLPAFRYGIQVGYAF